ncbi:MAG: anhydro-N-acetylmuramic acid kinase [Rhodocyclaceae bacterium]|nr:MAG: anhydro-N-acetylmuramic acid kinase [Rhodocyclaceae bacterium]
MEETLYIGLMSGTSLDGVDAVLIGFSDRGLRTLAASHLPYGDELRRDLLRLNSPGQDELHRAALLSNTLAALYAKTVQQVLADSGIHPRTVKALGCHGQTVRHHPDFGYTLQLNNPALLAELTGIAVVADFRSRDMAAGGQGAPLVPAFHAAQFQSATCHRVLLNLGGIANISDLRPGRTATGFDCGPANMLLDAWIQACRGELYDEHGNWSASGKVLPELLERLLTHPFFALQPPKSCGREEFNLSWLNAQLQGDETPEDVQATLLRLTCDCCCDAIRRWCGEPDELYVCGGGAYNKALLAALTQALGIPVETTSILGIAPNWVEATAFAWLAKQHLEGLPGNLPAVTGARGPRVLGALYPA